MTTVRVASKDDVPALSDLMFVDPPREAVALAGGARPARRFQAAMFAEGLDQPGSVAFVAVDDDELVGFAWLGGGAEVPSLRRVAALAVRSMGVGGALRAAWPASSRLAVDMSPPPGGVHLTELHVHPARRGRGIGGALLDRVETYARDQRAAHLSLTTGATNPARHLYERHGFEVVQERSGRRYTRLTGIPGRVLMVKALGTP